METARAGGATRPSRLRTWLLAVVVVLLVSAVVLLFPLLRPLGPSRSVVPPGADSIVVVAGERYRAGLLLQLWLGRHYRALWTEPVKVAVLQLGDFAGGLRATRESGGKETLGLHFTGANGRHFVFRSVDKEITRVIPENLRRSLLAWMLQDQTSAAHPAGALVAAPLQAAVGLPFTHPFLTVLPDDARLGQFRIRFAGLLGVLQESPGEDLSGPPDTLAGERVRETDSLLALLAAGPGNQVDARGFLTARLLDLLLNDWDRHEGQWRWLPEPMPWGTLWRPDPIDRDQAFARYSGLLLDLVRVRLPKLSKFGPRFPSLRGLTWNSLALDQRLLSGLGRPLWDSIAGFVAKRLTDSVITGAVGRLPEPYWRLSGALLIAGLEQRRGQLRTFANRFYLELARQPEVYTSGAGQLVELHFEPDGALTLVLSADSAGGRAAPWFRRRFEPAETRRIVLHFQRGEPRVLRTGTDQGKIALRIVPL